MKLKPNKKYSAEIDRELSERLQAAIPDPPRDEWFVRKTLNRLPPRRHPLYAYPEVIACLLVCAAGLIVAAVQTHRFIIAEDPFKFDFTGLICALGVSLVAAVTMLIPSLSREL